MELLTDKLLELTGDLRYERKFCVSELMHEEIEGLLMLHPAVFQEIYHKRIINNIYLDTHDLRLYRDNIDGKDSRVKIRIRWYGDLFGKVNAPYLEIKIKKAHCGYKLRYPLKDFVLDDKFSIDDIRDVFSKADLPGFLSFYLNDLKMALLNSYERKYYISSDKKYRVTIDSELRFYRAHQNDNKFLVKSTLWHDKIIEIKYESSQDTKADGISKYFPFSLARHSKYVRGIEEVGC